MPQSLRTVLRMAREKRMYVCLSSVDGGDFYCATHKHCAIHKFDCSCSDDDIGFTDIHFTDIDELTAWLAKKVSE